MKSLKNILNHHPLLSFLIILPSIIQCQEIKQPINGSASTDQSKISTLFTQMDSNHDSVLTLPEFQSNIRFYDQYIKSSTTSDNDNNNQQDGKLWNVQSNISEYDRFMKSSPIYAKSSTTTTDGDNDNNDQKSKFWNGFSSSTTMIIATEIGDKTFFIAAVLSMRNSRLVVFSGAIMALILMTILSTMMGLILPSILPRQYTHIIGGILFFYFGIKLIYDSKDMEDKVSDELEEVEEELLYQGNKKDESTYNQDDNEHGSAEKSKQDPLNIDCEDGKKTEFAADTPAGYAYKHRYVNSYAKVKKVLLQGFLLTFVAEWGDRSQIATIALAANKDPYGVTFGACFGHSLCTGLAVIGGRMLASQISERTVSFWGGIIFLGFGIHSLIFES